jgi:hypothetical protein
MPATFESTEYMFTQELRIVGYIEAIFTAGIVDGTGKGK